MAGLGGGTSAAFRDAGDRGARPLPCAGGAVKQASNRPCPDPASSCRSRHSPGWRSRTGSIRLRNAFLPGRFHRIGSGAAPAAAVGSTQPPASSGKTIMSAELLVNVTPRETRVALIESGVLQEVFIERANRRGLVGNIYKGRVCRVLPGMQAAFVDIGLDRAAFLHASDIADTDAKQVRDAPASDEGGPDPAQTGPAPILRNATPITELVRDGQEVLVQVIKDPLGTKGARLTTHVSIPSCYLVYMPGAATIGISQRIEDEEERNRLREFVRDGARRSAGESAAPGEDGEDWMPEDGYIVRTAAEGCSGAIIEADMAFLHKLWGVDPRTCRIGQRTGHRARGSAARDPHPARTVVHGHRAGADRFARDPRPRARLHRPVPVGNEPAHRALRERRPHLRSLRGGGRDPEGPAPKGTAQIGRARRDRPDRGDDHRRRQHRRVRRASQLRRDHLQDEPRSGPDHRAAAPPAQSGGGSSSSTSST